MFKKIKAYHSAIINKGVEHVTSEFDKRALKLLNFICLYSAAFISPIIFTINLTEGKYSQVFVLLFTEVILVTVIYLNSIGKSQVSSLVFLFSVNTLAYVVVHLEKEQGELPFVALSLGFFSIFLIKNQLCKLISFLYAFTTFSILYYVQSTEKEFGVSGYVLTLVILLIFATGLRFVNIMRNRDEKTILTQNETLKHQNEVIKTTSAQLIQLEKEKYEQELLLKQKDIEMILTNNQVQTQLNQNIIDKLKLAKQKGELEQNINQVILELHQQNEINTKMKLIEENMDVVNTSFFENLTKAHPNMTRVDKEFCSYIRIGLSSKEIASIRSTTVNTVNVNKTRLRKKLNLEKGISIASYLKSF